ncbi:hypothetical protein F4808DRAFT_452794 [Astrocystis sublimbata]|nr:hypothetical protein F4808DRAFT_452794 [Astrocystis sublimbata]
MPNLRGSPKRKREEESPEPAYESDIDSSIDFDETTGIATFPSGRRYSVHGLDIGTRDTVIRALATPDNPSKPKLAFRGCSSREQEYVFLVSETIEYHVKVPYGRSSRHNGPGCSCRGGGQVTGLRHPCRHTLWLCDQILNQLVPLSSDPYTWMIDGYTTEHGNVCDYVKDFHFDVLADSLRCDIKPGDGPRPRRIQTAREILATLSGKPIRDYRPDLTGEHLGKKVVKEGDLEETIFRMLLANDSLLEYFLGSMRNHGSLNPRFRRFRDRADATLQAFDEYRRATDLKRAELQKDPAWCYRTFNDILKQINSILKQIRSIMIHSERKLDDFDQRAAASTLVYILDQIISRNDDGNATHSRDGSDSHDSAQADEARKFNLFNELIVESGHLHSILDTLDELQPEHVNHLLPDLSRIEQSLVQANVHGSYRSKLGRIISHLRDTGSISGPEPAGSSRKRTSHGDDRYHKRIR